MGKARAIKDTRIEEITLEKRCNCIYRSCSKVIFHRRVAIQSAFLPALLRNLGDPRTRISRNPFAKGTGVKISISFNFSSLFSTDERRGENCLKIRLASTLLDLKKKKNWRPETGPFSFFSRTKVKYSSNYFSPSLLFAIYRGRQR